MKQELIDELYNISNRGTVEDFKNNIEFFREYYKYFIRNRIPNDKMYTILKIILKNHNLMEEDYLISNILDSLKYVQEKTCWKISQSKDTSLEDLELILNEIKEYNDIKNLVSNLDYDTENSINKSSANKYINSEIYIYYIDSLMRILSDNYLILSKEKSDEIMDLIYNNGWLNELLKGKIENSMLNRDLINKYIQRILTIKEFVSTEDISEDKLVSAITSYKIKDTKLLQNLISYLTPSKLISIFDYEMDKLMKFIINIDYADDYFKVKLIANVIQKYANEDNYYYLFDLLQSDIVNNQLISVMVDDKEKEKIIKFALDDSLENWNDIQYLLNQNILESNFLSNSMALDNERKNDIKEIMQKEGILTEEDYKVTIDNNDLDSIKQQKMEIYNLTGRIVDYDISIELLSKYFNNEIQLSIESTKAIVRSIITYQLEKNKIKDVKILFNNSKETNGSFNIGNENKYITISTKQIKKFLEQKLPIKNRLELFVTMFHEMRHAIKRNNIDNNNFDYDTYFMLKEKIIEKYDSNYYNSNYRLILEEIDAREDGYVAAYSFLKENFPLLESTIRNNCKSSSESYNYSDYNEKNFSITNKKEFVNKILDKLISMHPELIQKYPVLQLEYHLDGKVKNQEKIQKFGDYDIELINQIIDKRYGNNRQTIEKVEQIISQMEQGVIDVNGQHIISQDNDILKNRGFTGMKLLVLSITTILIIFLGILCLIVLIH